MTKKGSNDGDSTEGVIFGGIGKEVCASRIKGYSNPIVRMTMAAK